MLAGRCGVPLVLRIAARDKPPGKFPCLLTLADLRAVASKPNPAVNVEVHIFSTIIQMIHLFPRKIVATYVVLYLENTLFIQQSLNP